MKLKIPATSANLGIGFDSIGVALNLFNTFTLNLSNTWKIDGFDTSYVDDNLVIKVYKDLAKKHNKAPNPISVSLDINEVPISRGLGSSATCILAGVLASNEFNNLGLSYDECIYEAALIEGHPDNIYPAAYGGLISSFKHENEYIYDSFEINKDLLFTLLIPNCLGSTEQLRKVLPSTVSYQHSVHNLSRMIHLPKAFKKGDITLLKKVLDDKLHEPYRFPHIPMFDELQNLKENKDLVLKISGSGPTVLIISKIDVSDLIPKNIKEQFTVKTVTPFQK